MEKYLEPSTMRADVPYDDLGLLSQERRTQLSSAYALESYIYLRDTRGSDPDLIAQEIINLKDLYINLIEWVASCLERGEVLSAQAICDIPEKVHIALLPGQQFVVTKLSNLVTNLRVVIGRYDTMYNGTSPLYKVVGIPGRVDGVLDTKKE